MLRPYKDQAGKLTVGVGHLIRTGEDFSAGISHDQAMELLAQDVASAEGAVNVHVTRILTQNAFDACVSFTFNCGGGAFASSGILRCINAGDMLGAGNAFLVWDKRQDPATGQLVEDRGLFARRNAERELFLAPDADDLAPSATALLEPDETDTRS